MNNTNSKKQIRNNSIALGLFFSADMLTKIVSSIFSINNNLPLIYLIIFSISLLSNLFFKGIYFKKTYIASFFIIFALLLISMLRVNPIYTKQYTILFISFYALAGYSLQLDFSSKTIFKTVNIVNLLFTLYLLIKIFPAYNSKTLDIDYTMDLSYTALIGIFSFFLYFYLSETKIKNNKVIYLLSLLCVGIEIYFLFVVSYNRGALLSLMVFIFIFGIRLFKSSKVRLSLTLIAVGICYFIYSNLYSILNSISNYMLFNFGIHLNWLTKTTYLISVESVGSGREQLYADAQASFAQAPFIGNGIGSFASTHGGQYPHNLFLESLTDQGIFVTMVLVAFVLYTLIYLILKEKNDVLLLLIFLFSLSIPRLMISSTIWNSVFFWGLVILFFSNNNFSFRVNKDTPV